MFESLLKDVVAVEGVIRTAKEQLGKQSDGLGILRRGAETHVNLRPLLQGSAELQKSSERADSVMVTERVFIQDPESSDELRMPLAPAK